MSRKSGLFVSFEGIDGSGKSTQALLLHDALRAEGRDALLTREPGGSPGAEEIRALVLNGDPDRWSATTELLLFTAARRDHVERVIRPALAEGRIVICDRFADSTRAYQGTTRGDLRDTVDKLHDLVIGIEPDLTFLVDMDPETSFARAEARIGSESRFESFGSGLQARLRAIFLDMAKAHPERFEVIDGDHPPEIVASEIRARLAARLEAA
ncbi:dTMP kinase [Litorisediminicola beolgyonensis]|uniref:Thymidylate kinase n=1 Tax=Litorisediminicola beolgyonensis TaxID=1173614 RepID=A0ABW3ZKG0_9RHOB